MSRITSVRRTTRLPALALAGALGACIAPSAFAQLVNYGEALASYKDVQQGGVKLNDTVFPAVSARATVNRAIAQQTLIEQSALLQSDGTLKLPDNQNNVVIRTTYNDVSRGADGSVRVGSPTIQGNINGNVTLFVDGKGVQNITVLNNGH